MSLFYVPPRLWGEQKNPAFVQSNPCTDNARWVFIPIATPFSSRDQLNFGCGGMFSSLDWVVEGEAREVRHLLHGRLVIYEEAFERHFHVPRNLRRALASVCSRSSLLDPYKQS